MSRNIRRSMAGLVVLVGVAAVAPRAWGYLTVYGMPTSGPAGNSLVVQTLQMDMLGAMPKVGDGVAATVTVEVPGRTLSTEPSYLSRWDASGGVELAGSVEQGRWARARFRDMNAAGTVVGEVPYYGTAADVYTHVAARWEVGAAVPTLLETLTVDAGGRPASSVSAINNAGVAVGEIWQYDGAGIPVQRCMARWDASGALTVLESPYPTPQGVPTGVLKTINDQGVAIGLVGAYDSEGRGQGARAARWDADDTMPTLLNGVGGVPLSHKSSIGVIDINSVGTILGVLDGRPVRWDAGSTSAIEVGGVPGLDASTDVRLISDSGMLVGGGRRNDLSGAPAFAVRWWPDGQAQVLETLMPDGDSVAFDINAAGIIAGNAETVVLNPSGSPPTHAVIWGLDGKVVDLNTLIDPDSHWWLVSATSISNTGWVAGYGYYDDPETELDLYRYPIARPWMMYVPMAVPEPAGVVMMAMSLLAMAGWRGRRG